MGASRNKLDLYDRESKSRDFEAKSARSDLCDAHEVFTDREAITSKLEE